MHSEVKNRLIIVFALFVSFLSLIVVTSFYRQVINRDKLIAYSEKQILRSSKVYPRRGNIYDRNGSPLAINLKTYSIFALPKHIKEKNIISKLHKIVPKLTKAQLRKKLKGRRRYTWIGRKLSLTDEQVSALKKIKGIYVESVPKRFYPNQELLAQTLGFVGVDNAGLAGIEYRFDKLLRGKPREVKYLKDAKGRAVKYVSEVTGEKAKDIYLTIDKELQMIVEKNLQEVVEEFHALKAGAAVMDVKTGEILAIANYPTFNPNHYRTSKAQDRTLSYISAPFEPGSVFKTFTVAAALEHKVAKADTNYYCERGRFKVQDHYIKEAESHEKFEWLSVGDILRLSSNIGTTKIAFDLTYPKLKETLLNFNIGKRLNIQLSGESRGIFDTTKENISPLHLSNLSFGQGIATTALQILAGYAAIANNGFYHYPTIIKGQQVAPPYQVISEKTALELQQMLEKVVSDGTGTRARIKYFHIAGKTSTAQRPVPGVGYEGYIPGFVGFPLNVENRFVSFVYVEKPVGRRYFGNQVAAPVFKRIAEYILYKNRNLNQLAVNTDKPEKVLDRVEYKAASRLRGKGVIPNFIGMDKVSARDMAKKLKLKISSLGSGIVAEQSPEAGSTYQPGAVVTLRFKIPEYE